MKNEAQHREISDLCKMFGIRPNEVPGSGPTVGMEGADYLLTDVVLFLLQAVRIGIPSCDWPAREYKPEPSDKRPWDSYAERNRPA